MTPPEGNQTEKATKTMVGTVENIIPALSQQTPKMAQISIAGGEYLYRELRIENSLQDNSGNTVGPRKGAMVEVTIKAEAAATEKI